MFDLVIKGGHVVDGAGAFSRRTSPSRGNVFTTVGNGLRAPRAQRAGSLVIPAAVDPHRAFQMPLAGQRLRGQLRERHASCVVRRDNDHHRFCHTGSRSAHARGAGAAPPEADEQAVATDYGLQVWTVRHGTPRRRRSWCRSRRSPRRAVPPSRCIRPTPGWRWTTWRSIAPWPRCRRRAGPRCFAQRDSAIADALREWAVHRGTAEPIRTPSRAGAVGGERHPPRHGGGAIWLTARCISFTWAQPRRWRRCNRRGCAGCRWRLKRARSICYSQRRSIWAA